MSIQRVMSSFDNENIENTLTTSYIVCAAVTASSFKSAVTNPLTCIILGQLLGAVAAKSTVKFISRRSWHVLTVGVIALTTINVISRAFGVIPEPMVVPNVLNWLKSWFVKL